MASSWSDLPRREVLAELERVLGSPQFRTSRKCSRFLRHIVEAAVEGRFDCLKERTLGVDVFDRESHYDTNQDPIVRGTAGEVRKRLAQYYVEAEHDGELRFSLPPGSYVPEAHYIVSEPPIQTLPLVDSSAHTPKPHNSRAIAGSGLALCALLTISSWLLLRPTSLDRFWTPVLAGKSVLVCLGQPQLYAFHTNTARLLNSWFVNATGAPGAPPPIASVPLNEIVPMWDSSVALADTQAFSRLANLFARKAKQVDVRGEMSVSLADLRGKPAVFVGAFDNQWAMTLAGELRFYFDADEQKHAQFIRDRQRPGATDWKLVDAWPPGRDINKDYALVTRVVNRTTEQTVVILGGIAQYGTQAAAEFVTDPAYFETALAHAPRDWSGKNIQIVLSTRVLSGVSGPPTVVAVYFW
ncbi:MAG TPA: hypothetical protein VGL97_15220 [Bryobacteraceae bacterium]